MVKMGTSNQFTQRGEGVERGSAALIWRLRNKSGIPKSRGVDGD
jgi:hypothetical protein